MRKVALVTGGTRGIGLGVARSLAMAGVDLVLCGMRPTLIDSCRNRTDC